MNGKDKWNDPANYRAMSEPHESNKAQDAIDAFMEDCHAARQKHRMMDVSIIVLCNIKNDDGTESPGMSRLHLGDPQRAQSMLARAYGDQQATDREYHRRLVETATRR